MDQNYWIILEDQVHNLRLEMIDVMDAFLKLKTSDYFAALEEHNYGQCRQIRDDCVEALKKIWGDE